MVLSISPEIEIDPELLEDESPFFLLTYRIDFETGELTNEKIDGIEAIKQFVHLSLKTPRHAYPIYTHAFGSEIEALLADKNVTDAFKISELPRLVEEALIYDYRIEAVDDISIEKIADAFHVRLTVISDVGALEMLEVFENEL